MPIDVSEAEYFDVLSRLLDTANPCVGSATHGSREHAKAATLIWAYDPLGVPEAMRDLSFVEFQTGEDQKVALTVVVGRAQYGRPAGHPRYREILAFRDHYSWHHRWIDRAVEEALDFALPPGECGRR